MQPICSVDSSTSPASSGISAANAQFLSDVHEGLSQPRKQLHCKYFYDERGSKLFDQICELEEYYPTRTEAQIVLEHAAAMGQRIGPQAVVVEYGSGSSTKTRLLLDHLPEPRAYLPVDISEEHLLKTAQQLQADYPNLDVHPIVADFTSPFDLPDAYQNEKITVYFPGSTIGNLQPAAAVELLRQMAAQCGHRSGERGGDRGGERGGLLIGIDLEKDEVALRQAYDDSQGVTAEFNLNLLHRINRELEGDFDVSQFAHVAVVNRQRARVEIFIESLKKQTVHIENIPFTFEKGERIFTEYAHKYQIDGFASMAREAGLVVDTVWTDSEGYFAVMYFRTDQASGRGS